MSRAVCPPKPEAQRSSDAEGVPALSFCDLDRLPEAQWPVRIVDAPKGPAAGATESMHKRQQLAKELRSRGAGLSSASAVTQLEHYVSPSCQVEFQLRRDAVVAATEHANNIFRTAASLTRMGYRISVRHVSDTSVAWAKPMSHTFLVCHNTEGASEVEYIIDMEFKDFFRTAFMNATYTTLWHTLPPIFVGPAFRLAGAVQLLSEEVEISFLEAGRPLPPWRSASAAISRWISSSFKDTPIEGNPSLTSQPSGSSISTSFLPTPSQTPPSTPSGTPLTSASPSPRPMGASPPSQSFNPRLPPHAPPISSLTSSLLSSQIVSTASTAAAHSQPPIPLPSTSTPLPATTTSAPVSSSAHCPTPTGFEFEFQTATATSQHSRSPSSSSSTCPLFQPTPPAAPQPTPFVSPSAARTSHTTPAPSPRHNPPPTNTPTSPTDNPLQDIPISRSIQDFMTFLAHINAQPCPNVPSPPAPLFLAHHDSGLKPFSPPSSAPLPSIHTIYKAAPTSRHCQSHPSTTHLIASSTTSSLLAAASAAAVPSPPARPSPLTVTSNLSTPGHAPSGSTTSQAIPIPNGKKSQKMRSLLADAIGRWR